MTNLEHLVENGIVLLEKDGTTYDHWIDVMSKDCNWRGNEHITIQDLWQICQYVVYTYKS